MDTVLAMESRSLFSDETVSQDGDLSDYDIHQIMESIQSRQSKVVAQCVLNIRVLYTEIQQQLLELMVENKAPPEAESSNSLSNSLKEHATSNSFAQFDQDEITHQRSQEEEKTSTKPLISIATASTVPITGAISKKPQTFACSECERVFVSQKALTRHENTHKTQELEKAREKQEKGSEFVPEEQTESVLRASRKNPPKKRRAGSNERVSCPLCGIETLKHHMARHMLLHTGIKPYECDLCGKSFHRKDKLQDHQKRTTCGKGEAPQDKPKVSTAPKQHTCRKCGYQTYDVKDFKIHRKSHPPPNKYRCDICDKDFSCPSHLEQHNIKHSDLKPFICDMCGVAFSREPNLLRHIKSHVEPAPHRCKFCEKPYYRQNELVVHERTHTGEKPFVCEKCGNSYASAKYLKRHLFTHSGLKPHKCDICEKGFSRLENMRAHKKIHSKPKNRANSTITLADPVATAFQTSQHMGTVSGEPSRHPDDGLLPNGIDLYQLSANSTH